MENVSRLGLSISVSKTKTPDYKKRVEQGLPLPDNPYSLLITKHVQQKVAYDFIYANGSVQTGSLDNWSIINETGWSDSARRNKENSWISVLNNKVLEKVKGQSLPIIQLYVERKETASALRKLIDESIFIARNVRRPSKIFKKFGRSTTTRQYRKVRNSVRLLASKKNESVGSAWLQYRMFLTPLYHDVMSGLAANADYEKKIHTSSVSASAKFQENLDFTGSTYSLLIPTSRREGVWSIKGGAKMKVTYSITDTSLSALTSLADPLAVAWDLVPWSFIVDRFADLGSYLELRNATVGTSFRTGCLSYFFEWTATPSTPWVNTYYPNQLLWSINGYKHEFRGVENFTAREISTGRRVLSTFPPVVLEFPFRQGWKQITDEIVLLRQLLGKRLR